ncbi:hypothetical protein BC832DRAFT_578648 [Gaertneriomyces semiglobifer]|nr:hypothetical protein BC832DRAFT_578648 [Gaertneriomyces semiglobifer]
MATRTARMSDKAANERNVKALKEIMMRPDNRRCVDCRKKDPRWASWNLGVFFCIRCSGHHRGMGTHISKVKSADLDSWTEEQVAHIGKWGNAKANIYWEHELPPDFTPDESRIEQFIRAKYERKQYAMKGPLPDPDTLSVPGATPTTNRTASAASTPAPAAPTAASAQASLFADFTSAPPPKQKSDADQLLDVFAPAPSSDSQRTQSQPQTDALKNSILSLYGNNGAPTAGSPTFMQPQGFLSFAGRPPISPQTSIPSFAAFPPVSNVPSQTQPMGAQFFGSAAPAPSPTQASGTVGGIPDFMSFSGSQTNLGNPNKSGGASTGDDWGAFQ